MTKTNAKADRNTAPPRIALRVDIALLVCGLFYILAEFIFNARLLDTASDIAATADDLRDVEYLGRAVSGVGLTLLVAGFFARDGFRMSRLSDQIVFGLLALVCPLLFLLSPLAAAGGGLDPAGTTFTQLITGRGAPVDLDVPPPDASMAWIILPFIGIFMVLVAHYLKLHRVMVVAGLAAMTWMGWITPWVLLTFTFLFLLWRAGATLLLACLYTAGMWLILWGLFDQIVHIVWSPAWLF